MYKGKKEDKMKKEKNNWRTIAIILIIILIFIATIQYPKKNKEIEWQKTCIDNCVSEFDECLNNITTPTFPSNPKILDCLWDENICVEYCQTHDYYLQRALGRI